MVTDRRTATAPAASAPVEETGPEPIVIDLGKKNRKQVRKLRRGKPGRLMDRVEDALDHLRQSGAMAAEAQPVVIVIRQRPKKRRGGRIAKAWGLG